MIKAKVLIWCHSINFKSHGKHFLCRAKQPRRLLPLTKKSQDETRNLDKIWAIQLLTSGNCPELNSLLETCERKLIKLPWKYEDGHDNSIHDIKELPKIFFFAQNVWNCIDWPSLCLAHAFPSLSASKVTPSKVDLQERSWRICSGLALCGN